MIKAPYDDNYIESLFQYWYQHGSPVASEFAKMLERDQVKDSHGRIPTEITLGNWLNEKGFRARKDLLDAKVSSQIDDDLVNLKIQTLREQAAGFRAVRQKALDFLLANEFDSSSSAVNAFIRASQEERVAHGLSRAIQKIAAMDDDALVQQVRQLASEVSGEVIDMEDVSGSEEEDAT